MYSCPANHMAVIHPGRTGDSQDTWPREAPTMSSRLVRLDALVFRADSVRFEACPTYRGTPFAPDGDADLCECGWLEADHSAVVVSRRRFPRRRLQPAAVRAAS